MSTYISFCVAIAQLAAACGGRCTSWWRTPVGNMEQGGHKYSRHQVGEGVDWAWSDEELKASEVVDDEGIRTNGRERMMVMAADRKLKVIDEGDHLHVQTI
ncbi:hypothetical protein LCGC14_2343350 [marine sediment metagenome]|uniref:Peptidase M15A C-terminal domain-containing protein n=1 Tax=marine sediment metagenome TaxID=412755 RepID=A0A0F9CB86_9ZZZZ